MGRLSSGGRPIFLCVGLDRPEIIYQPKRIGYAPGISVGPDTIRWPMPTPVQSSHNLHTLACYGGTPLGVFCCSCRKYGTIPADRLKATSGNMTLLNSIRFVCSRCSQRGTGQDNSFLLYLFVNQTEAEAFLQGRNSEDGHG
jgi:hypothetical protein